jgi:hypothetical protein
MASSAAPQIHPFEKSLRTSGFVLVGNPECWAVNAGWQTTSRFSEIGSQCSACRRIISETLS